MSDGDWHLEVGSDVPRDEFFAEVWTGGEHWASVVEREGKYWLRVEQVVELECDHALDALREPRRRVTLIVHRTCSSNRCTARADVGTPTTNHWPARTTLTS